VKVTYTFRGETYTIQPLYYRQESVHVPGERFADGSDLTDKDKALDIEQHTWPTDSNNMEDIISQMVDMLQNADPAKRERFQQFLRSISENIYKSLARIIHKKAQTSCKSLIE
jgi:hypothetical protein